MSKQRIELILVDVKLNTNAPNIKDTSLTSDLLSLTPLPDSTLSKYPIICENAEIPRRKLAKMKDYNRAAMHFFDTDMMERLISNNVKEIEKITDSDKKRAILETNIMTMLYILFPTKFPSSNNIYESYKQLTNSVDVFTNITISAYTFLQIGGTTYTVTQVIWLNEMLNNPFYRNLVANMIKYLKWAENAKVNIVEDAQAKYQILLKLTNIYKQFAHIDIDILKGIKQPNNSRYLSANIAKIERLTALLKRLIGMKDDIEANNSYIIEFTYSDNKNYKVYFTYLGSVSPNFKNVFASLSINIYTTPYVYTPLSLIDWPKTSATFTFTKGSTSVSPYSDLRPYTKHVWNVVTPENPVTTMPLPKGSIVFNGDTFTIRFGEDQYNTAKANMQNITGVYISIAKITYDDTNKTITLDKDDFLSRVNLDEVVKVDSESDPIEKLFDTLTSIRALKIDVELSKQFNDLMEECSDIDLINMKYAFFKKFLQSDEPTLDVNNKKFTGDYFAPFLEATKTILTAMSRTRKLLNTKLQKQIDNYGYNREGGAEFITTVRFIDDIIYGRRPASDMRDIYKTTLSEINFGKPNVPKYETYAHLDLLQGKADDSNVKTIKCKFQDINIYNMLLKQRPKAWRLSTLPFYDIATNSAPKARADGPIKKIEETPGKTVKPPINTTNRGQVAAKGGKRRTRKKRMVYKRFI
jgi:hypothetical protein